MEGGGEVSRMRDTASRLKLAVSSYNVRSLYPNPFGDIRDRRSSTLYAVVSNLDIAAVGEFWPWRRTLERWWRAKMSTTQRRKPLILCNIIRSRIRA